MRKTFFVALLLLVFSSSVFAGNEMGNGAENHIRSDNSAWFLGREKIVKSCIDRDQNFPLETTDLKTQILKAFETWLKYLESKGIEKIINTPEYMYYARRIQFNLQCDGTEDLKFFFGKEDPEIVIAKNKYQNPTAFTMRTHFDSNEAWSKGYIWVAPQSAVFPDRQFPDWKKPNQLFAVLLHEIGHIFGTGHIDGTIMDRNLSIELYSNNIKPSAMTSIDGQRELYFCSSCAFNYKGTMGAPWNPQNGSYIFEKIIGRKPQGSIRAEFLGTNFFGVAQLKISDNVETTEFKLSFHVQRTSPIFEDDGVLFKRFKQNFKLSLKNEGRVIFGSITSAVGASAGVILEFNPSNADSTGPVNLKKMFNNGMTEVIFRAN